ncbi:MAG: hypothetical protein DRI44_06670 [Chlamydiae bacterium]|nr:MAG: hypothetical protein DRI44_06670 [Chlamydiota bacterium]
MKLLFLNANIAGCGTYHRALWFGRLCAEYGGHDVTICTVSRDNKWKREERIEKGVAITEGPNWGYKNIPGYGSNWLDILWRWRRIVSGNYDVIFGFEYHPNVSWPIYAGLKRNQIFLSDWCDWYSGAANHFRGNKIAHKWDKRREEKIRLKADRVSVISSVLFNRTLDVGVDKNNIALLREGVDTNYMRPYPKEDARLKLGIQQNVTIIGTLTDGHAFPFLIESFKKVKKEINNAYLLLVGGLSDEHRNLIISSGIQNAFISTGRCSDEELPVFLSAADIFALPMADNLANKARFPHKIGDYLACARPLVVTRVGDYPEMLSEDGVAVVTENQDDFTIELINLIKNKEKQNFLAQKSREWVVEKLDWSALAPGILKFVEG